MNPDLTGIVRAIDRLVASQQKGAWDYAATIVVVLALIVLVWYTIETYKLRKAAQAQTAETANLLREAQRQNVATLSLVAAAQRQNEIGVMPILAIRIEPPQSRLTASGVSVNSYLVLRNEGAGPAFNVCIDPYSVGGRELAFDHGSGVVSPKEVRELSFHLQQGNSGTIGNVNELYYWINTGELPDPLCIPVRCKSVSSTDYTFTFRFTPLSGVLAVMLETMDSSPRSQRSSSVVPVDVSAPDSRTHSESAPA